jgi:hypothetical protein
LRGVGIVDGTDLLQGQVEVGRMIGTAEHEVFHQVSETGARGIFIAGTHAINNGACGQRRGVVLMNQYVQTVGKDLSGERYCHRRLSIFRRQKYDLIMNAEC